METSKEIPKEFANKVLSFYKIWLATLTDLQAEKKSIHISGRVFSPVTFLPELEKCNAVAKLYLGGLLRTHEKMAKRDHFATVFDLFLPVGSAALRRVTDSLAETHQR